MGIRQGLYAKSQSIKLTGIIFCLNELSKPSSGNKKSRP